MSDLISVVLPTYNGEKYLRESIESVIGQTYENWELIIVNDASTDSTLNIAKEYANKDKRVFVISNETNQKLPKSLNIGFANAKGEYYTWTSDDNLYKPQAFEKMLGALKQDASADMVCCDIEYIDENGKTIQMCQAHSNLEKLLMANTVQSCFLYTKEIAAKTGQYDGSEFLVEDYDYWLRIALNGKIITLSENLYRHRLHKDSLSTTKSSMVNKKASELQKRYWRIFLPKFPNLKETYKEFELECNINSLISLPKDKATALYRQINNTLSKKEAYQHYRHKFKQTKNVIYLDAMSELGFFYKLKALDYKIKLMRKNKKSKEAYHTSQSHIQQFHKAKQWIFDNTLTHNNDNTKQGIILSSDQRVIYPEVTGYYIPTLLKWGERELAKSYADYLLTIQNEDGSWNEPYGKHKYTFDTGQILKGLWEFIDSDEKYKKAFLKGCDYIVAQQRENGSIATDNYDYWGLHYGKVVPESIHLYCLEPLQNAAKKFNLPKYEECIKKALDFYLKDESLTDFNTLSHFNAYIIEALIDLGQNQRAQSAMDKIATYQRKDGFIPAYSHTNYTCSTGLFQYAVCWAKLGGEENLKKADKAFYYALALQNDSGGWFGSYGKKALYFPNGEISWAVKYFLDGLWWIKRARYALYSYFFPTLIYIQDERYKTFATLAKNAKKILDVGCGGCRYARNLIETYPNKDYYGIDLSKTMLDKYSLNGMNTTFGHLLNIPYEDNSFDFVFVAEAFCHCVDIHRALQELIRVSTKDAKILIIDKNIKKIGTLAVADFEQWFEPNGLKSIMESYGLKVEVRLNLSHIDNCGNINSDDLFVAWIGEKI